MNVAYVRRDNRVRCFSGWLDNIVRAIWMRTLIAALTEQDFYSLLRIISSWCGHMRRICLSIMQSPVSCQHLLLQSAFSRMIFLGELLQKRHYLFSYVEHTQDSFLLWQLSRKTFR